MRFDDTFPFSDSMNDRPMIRWLCLCLVAAMAGCQSSISDDVATVESPAVADVVSVDSPTEEVPNDSEGADATQEGAEPAPKSAVQFSPAFPDRTELFEPPKRASSSVRRDDERGESVELKGFINVDTPRAVLSIDGVISPIAEGGEKYGVQVISIQPPSVVLQRGRSRWTATLE